jgi:hypothetical protein
VGNGTSKALVEKFGFSANRVIVLSDKKTVQAEIQKAFTTLKDQLKPLDTFFLFFIGHGSGDNGQYKFNISGPDFTADDYMKLLGTLSVGRIVIDCRHAVQRRSHLEEFAGKNRIVSSPRLKAERKAMTSSSTTTFLEALQSNVADEDKDQKVSVWKPFKYAVTATERFYKEEGRLATEHPAISDNGAPTADYKKDPPLLARATSFVVDRPIVSSDPKMQVLLNQRKDIEQKIEALRLNKSSVAGAEYDKQLEDLLVQLALKNQEIRQQETQKK